VRVARGGSHLGPRHYRRACALYNRFDRTALEEKYVQTVLSLRTATVAGQETTVSYAGQQVEVDGLDQVNLFLPRSLAGRGQIEIALGIDGWDADRVTVSIR
jgi:uncharacterized protein (TIGR03437 family)